MGRILAFQFLVVVSCVACGRYLPPIAPELSSPAAIKFKEVVADQDSVRLVWLAPEQSVRGKKLEKLDGYRVYRRVLPARQLSKGEEQPDYELAATVWDTTLAVRVQREEELERAYKPTRQAKLSEEERTVTFQDSNVSVGVQYLYKVAAFNQVGFDGPVVQFAEVLFDGEKSVVRKISSEDDAGLSGPGMGTEGEAADGVIGDEEA
jgi:hypothetical protein